MPTESFKQTLAGHGLQLTRGRIETLQVNMGLLCNQACRHCHLNAGPDRKENMNLETVDQVVDYARRSQFKTIDITGGAPELNPNLVKLMEDLVPLSAKIILRSNLSAMNINKNLVQFLEEHSICIVASFPSLNQTQVDSQRGEGSFKKIIDTLKNLNDVGYGHEGSGLELNLVSNPVGAFLPPPQVETERRFRKLLQQKWGIVFNSLFNFANVPVGRFRRWLEETGNFDGYMKKLVSAFNPCAIEGLMCRKLVSVSWDGFLYDCDFNLARGLPLGGSKIHVSEMSGPPEEGIPISASDHCFTCTAGTGFT
ncbi:MAG: arsenosugar biosynthesis radical SAM protein ArsS [Deltaproteobacteria bacterium]|nr:arsenosugar biosynthesis radical SAM protein ArsS [Deltaproteobacteria bacterium]